jgi:pyridoxal phosphate enzyme (YggS family)
MPFPDLPERLREIRDRIDAAVRRGGHGQAVTIVAVTKTHGPDAVQAAFDAGLGDVGENRVQEALPKMDAVQVPVRWHLIGHLQRNKVKSLARFDLLHSLDSARLADAVSEFGQASGKPVPCLAQVNVVGEETKGGFERAAWAAEADRLRGLPGIHVRGIMTMAPLDADEAILRRVFAGAREARDVFRAAGHEATELSMGMSNDYELAVEEGATLVRLGTILFGARPA